MPCNLVFGKDIKEGRKEKKKIMQTLSIGYNFYRVAGSINMVICATFPSLTARVRV